VFVALGIHQAMRTLHNVFCDMSGSTIFFHAINFSFSSEWGGSVNAYKMCFDFLYKLCLKHLILKRTEKD